MVSKWNHSQGASAMATTMTLKNLPDDIYERLKVAAKANHRSINSEVIACLEKALLSAQVSPKERLWSVSFSKTQNGLSLFSGAVNFAMFLPFIYAKGC